MTALLVKLFVKDHTDVGSKKVREAYGRLCGTTGIICNILLCIIKITVGIISHSISILADGFNNLSDMGSSVITMIGFKLSSKPPDRDHPFGHGRMEYMSAFIVSAIIIVVGFELFTSSVETLISGKGAPRYSILAMAMLAVSVLVKLWMYFFNKKIGKRIASSALCATALDSINDAIATTAILISAIASTLFDMPFNLDAVMAAGVALFIIWAGISSARGTLNEILGGPPPKELLQELETQITAFEGFLGIHDLIVHNYGPGRQFASVHVEVPQDTDIVTCHEQIDICERVVGERCGVELVIHMDPINTNDQSVSQARISMTQALKEINPALSLHDFRMTPSGERRTNLIFDVVIPCETNIDENYLKGLISDAAKRIDPTFCCVITIDRDFTGR